MSELLHAADFEPCLHTTFQAEQPTPVDLQLVEMEDRSNAGVEQFSLIFTGPASGWLQQGT